MKELMLSSWAPTQTNYITYITRWLDYYKMVGICDHCDATFKEGRPFLSNHFHDKEYKHGSIAVARSILLTILPSKDGKDFINQLPTNKKIILKMLTKKLCTLLFLLHGQFSQSFQEFSNGL